MSQIKLSGTRLSLLTFDPNGERRVEHKDAKVSFMACTDDFGDGTGEHPTLHVCARHDEGDDRAIFTIAGYEEILVLQRYCELTLELFNANRLA